MSEYYTLHQAIHRGEEILRASDLADPGWNAERLLMLALRCDRAALYAGMQRELSAEETEAYDRLLERRARHEPLAYLEGNQEFYGREFQVDSSVLIPRPETEEIVRAVLALELPAAPAILDLGAGSGCIAATLASEIPGARVTALEISTPALPVLRTNCGPRVHVVQGDMFRAPFADRAFDVVVSNPPYVEADEFLQLPDETKWEPRAALLASSLEFVYGTLLASARRLLRPGGYLVFEFGQGQESRIEKLIVSGGGVSKIGSRSDFRNILRTFILRKTGS